MSRDAWRTLLWTIVVELVVAGFALLVFTVPESGWYIAGRFMIGASGLVAWRLLRAADDERYRRSRS